jgi:hypothetical protein
VDIIRHTGTDSKSDPREGRYWEMHPIPAMDSEITRFNSRRLVTATRIVLSKAVPQKTPVETTGISDNK